jgi:hypothetical protein
VSQNNEISLTNNIYFFKRFLFQSSKRNCVKQYKRETKKKQKNKVFNKNFEENLFFRLNFLLTSIRKQWKWKRFVLICKLIIIWCSANFTPIVIHVKVWFSLWLSLLSIKKVSKVDVCLALVPLMSIVKSI